MKCCTQVRSHVKCWLKKITASSTTSWNKMFVILRNAGLNDKDKSTTANILYKDQMVISHKN